MNRIRLFLGRRKFLITFLSAILSLAFGRVAKAFDLIFKTSCAEAYGKPEVGEQRPLRGIVVYFSGTGNTAKIAGAIHRGMKSVIACDVAPIKKIKPEDMSRYAVIALGSPLWFERDPAIVKIFTNDMPRMDGRHCILFNTHGGSPISHFWSMSRNILKKGMTIIGWNDWFGPDRMSPHHDSPHMATGHPDEIDLKEAEAFGRQMAEYSQRIYAGEKDLIPEIPDPTGGGETNLWSASIDEQGHISSALGSEDSCPIFDLTKCVYPMCSQCIDNCPVNGIDFSVITTSGSADSPLVVKEACASCGGLCRRVCLYDAIDYEGEKAVMEVDMTRCSYPGCTLCVDNCPLDNIDFSEIPPIFHKHCENCAICWAICPEDALNILNMVELHLRQAWWDRLQKKSGMGGPPMMGGAGGSGQGSMPMGAPSSPKFRPKISREELYSEGLIMLSPDVPRIVLNKEDWPYEINEG